MEVRPSQRAQSQTHSSNLIQPQFFSHSLPQDTLAAASKSKRAANCVASLGTYLKSAFSFMYDFFVEILSSLGFEPSKLDIINTMFYDPKGNAKNFADSFKDSLNACVQAAFSYPTEVKEMLHDRKRKYKEFCKTLKFYIDKKSLQTQLTEYQDAAMFAHTHLLEHLSKEKLDLNGLKATANFVTLSDVFKNCCSEMAWLLKKSESGNKKELQETLKHLFTVYFPRVAFEIKTQPAAYIGFMKALWDLKALKGKPFVTLLETHFKPKNAEEKKHLATVFGDDAGEVMLYLTDAEFASSIGLSSPIIWKEIFLRAVTPEQFEALIPLYRINEAKGAKKPVLVELFKQIKETEESITFKRLESALEQMIAMFRDFEKYQGEN